MTTILSQAQILPKKSMQIMVLAKNEQETERLSKSKGKRNGWDMINRMSLKMGIPKSHFEGKVELQVECIVRVSHLTSNKDS